MLWLRIIFPMLVTKKKKGKQCSKVKKKLKTCVVIFSNASFFIKNSISCKKTKTNTKQIMLWLRSFLQKQKQKTTYDKSYVNLQQGKKINR